MATILPQAETQFTDALGVPLSGGTVTFYAPGTTTPKDTWLDSAQTLLNSNPVLLDSSGRAIIFGSGSYRQVVKDQLGNLIWDQTTSEAISGSASFGGTSTGTVNAQVVSAGTWSGADGSIINFTAGLTNTSAMTITVGAGGSPIAVLKNGPSGPVNLVAGDIAAGNIYSISYSVALGVFQLLQSLPAAIVIASQAEAQAGADNTKVMTPLRTNQAIQTLGIAAPAGSVQGDLLYATAPGVWARLPKGAPLQELRINAGATAPEWYTPPFKKSFESTQQTITSGGALPLPHGLAVQPKLYQAYVICQTAEFGYSIGDETAINLGVGDPNFSRGISLVPDATNINVRYGSGGISFLRKDTGAIQVLTNGNWKLVIRAWA